MSSNKNNKASIDREKLERCITLLSELKEIECEITYSKVSEEDKARGVVPCPYPHYKYPKELFEVESLLPDDYDYPVNIRKFLPKSKYVKDVDFSKLTIKNISTIITWVFEEERFGEGSIANGVRTGILLNSLLRLREILDEH